MKVLITGNEGYIGSVMSDYLLKEGHSVFGLDTNYFHGCDFSCGIVPRIGVNYKDVRDLVIEDFYGLDAVIYLSALSNDPLGEIRKEVTYDINYLSAIRTAILAREAGVKRFLFASSCSMYGAGNGDDVLTEESVQNPLTTYAESKVWAERGLSNLATDLFSPVFFRCGTAYGVSPRQRLDLVLNAMVSSAYKTGKIIVYNGGNAWRPVVHIEDISRAFNLGLVAPRNVVHNQAFNVGRNDDNYKVKELAEIVRMTVSGSKIKCVDDGVDTRSYKVSFDKITSELGFSPKWDATLGASQLIAAYELSQFKVINTDKYIRLNTIKGLIDSGELDEELRWT